MPTAGWQVLDDGVRVRKTINTNAHIVGVDMRSTIHVHAPPMLRIHDET